MFGRKAFGGRCLGLIALAGALATAGGCNTVDNDGSHWGGSYKGHDSGYASTGYAHTGAAEETMNAGPTGTAPAPAEQPAPARSSGSWGGGWYTPNAPGMNVSGLAFPTGDAKTSAVILHQVMPREVTLNSPFDYEYHVTNLTDGTLQNVNLVLESTQNLDIISADPAASAGAGRAMWMLGELGPRETKVVKVNARAGSVGAAANCATVSYNNVLCAGTNVVQPALALTKTATETARLGCDPIQYVFEVRNTGTGIARNVVLTDNLPNGVVTTDGQTNLNIPLGDLGPGEGKKITVNAKANSTGRFDNNASAAADGGLTANSNTVSTMVTQARLAMGANCTDKTFIGRNFTHSYTIRNVGDAACDNTVATIALPAGASYVDSTGGSLQGGNVVFNLGTMAPNAERTIEVKMSASSAGTFRSSATVSCPCSESASANCETVMTGIPAILLEVIDLDDPIEVGSQETYVITVTNQGSAQDTNIRIAVELPAEQEFVSAGGATQGSVNGRSITFAPLASLAPKAKAEWRVVVKALQAGDVRFAVEMTSDQLTRPVRETEATNLYQ
jgi:uncharacterized repeat protein (TIGR01451 family)